MTGDLQISGYEILRRIGEGGMGAIYLAEETSLGRRVAIKVISGKLSTDPQARGRFMREARSLATVEHPNVVRVYSFGEVEGHPYLAMEYVDGETLAERIRRTGRLPVEEAIRILRQILQALDAAWEKRIIHRDVKPSNILIDRRGQVHVVDFGLAKTTETDGDAALTDSGSVVGTPYYLAPEQAQGERVDFRADIYSCGILLFEMLAGERPFEGSSPLAIVAKQIHEPVPSIRARRSDVPKSVARLLEWMTEKKPSARAASYEELFATLDELQGITPARPITATATMAAVPASGRPRRLIAALIGIILLAGIAASIQWRRRTESAPSASDSGFVVAVAPFYGPDSDSEREGRLMAGLIERSIQLRLGDQRVRVIGIDETKTALRTTEAARELGERMHAGVVIWGEAFALRSETEVQPHFTIIQRPDSTPANQSKEEITRAYAKAADPAAALESKAPPVMRLESEAPNQIELRKTSADGVGEMVSLLAAVHALYTERNTRKALAFLNQVARTPDSLRYRAEAQLTLGDTKTALSLLSDVLAAEPNDVASHARIADLLLLQGRFAEAVRHYNAAALSGLPYQTHYGIVSGERFYQRETFRDAEYGSGKDDDTGYLLARRMDNGQVLARYRIPGVIQSFIPAASGFSLSYAFRNGAADDRTLHYRDRRFDAPLEYRGGNLQLRMWGMKSAWLLARNFNADVVGLLQKQPARPMFHYRNVNGDYPASLPVLETALRAAIDRDPTQPWHLFFLGQVYLAQGRAAEAAALWKAMLSRDFAVGYTDWSWMAKFFERYGQKEWADRAWARSMLERQKIPQPPQFTTLVERLINAPVVRLHPAQLVNTERAYFWLLRGRSETGMTECDHTVAAIWAGYFRRHHDPRAASEEEFLRRSRSDPMNFTAEAERVDYALHAWFATWFALLSTLTVLTSKRSSGNSGTASHDEPQRYGFSGRSARLVLRATTVGVVGYLLSQFWERVTAYSYQQQTFVGTPVIVEILALAGLAFLISERTLLLRRVAAAMRRGQRVALAVVFALCLVATFAFVRTANQHIAFASIPIGFADSVGHPDIIADLEHRLEAHQTAELTYCTAVANDYGRQWERAKALYAKLPDDHRARNALAALKSGRSAPAMPSSAELHRALTAGAGLWLLADPAAVNVAPGSQFPMNIVAWGTLGFTAVLLALFAFVKPERGASSVASRAPAVEQRRGRRWLAFIAPGCFDLTDGVPLIGIGVFVLAGLLVSAGASFWMVLRIAGAVGPFSATAMPNYQTALPLPLDVNRADVYLSAPGASLFFAILIGACVLVIAVHAWALARIWKSQVAAVADAPTLTAA